VSTENKIIYFDNAATSWPKPEPVYESLGSFLREKGANPGRSGHRMAQAAERAIDGTRNLVSSFLGVGSPERIIFTLNCTDALNIAIHGTVKKSSHVITTSLEHNSVTRVLNELRERKSVEITIIEPSEEGYIDPDNIRKSIRKNTSLIAINHGSNVTGALQDAGETALISRKKGIPFLLDAAQSAGAAPLDLGALGVSLCALPGHKGLLGPTGTGILYVSEDLEISSFRQGGTGTDSASPRHPDKYPFHLEAGTPNTSGIAALGEGIRYVADNFDSIIKREKELLGFLLEELGKTGGIRVYGPRSSEKRVGTISLNAEGWSPDDLGAVLDENFNIAVRTGLHCAPGAHRGLGTFPEGTVRVSCGPFNTEEEAEKLLSALREAVKL